MIKRLLCMGLVGLAVFVASLAAPKKSMLDRLVDLGESPKLEAVDPVIETVDDSKEMIADLVQRVDKLDVRVDHYSSRVGELEIAFANARTTETRTELDELTKQIEQLPKDQLANMKQSEAPVSPPAVPQPPEKTALAKELIFVYGDGCTPCEQWKTGSDREQIAAECHIKPVFVGDLPPELRPESLPAYTLELNGLRARHRGYLSFQRFKDMERAILEKLKTK